jgi:hypothetical protein
VRILEAYINKKRGSISLSLTPVIFLVLSIVFILAYMNFEPPSIEIVSPVMYASVSTNQLLLSEKISNCIFIFLLTNIPTAILIYRGKHQRKKVTQKKKIDEMKLREL